MAKRDANGDIVGTGGGSSPTDLAYTAASRLLESSTGADVTLPLVTGGDAGLAPASGGGTTNFLRADGTWAAPAGGGGYVLATEILADSPSVYWKFNDVWPPQDFSGNNYDIDTGNVSGDVQLRPFVPGDPGGKSIKIGPTSTAYMGITTVPFATLPANADWTWEGCVLLMGVGDATDPARFFVIAGTGETEAANYQVYVFTNTAGELGVFWEYGAGTNESLSSGIFLLPNVPYHLVVRKNGTPNTVDFFVGGVLLATVSYTNEPTGGGSAAFRVGADGTGGTAGFYPAHYAFYDGVALSDTRIMVHALAAGLAASPADTQGLGTRDIPQKIDGTTYTLALRDRGGHVKVTGDVTIPANSSVAFPVGATVTIYNNSSSSISISITTDTLRLAGTASTDARTLAQRGLVTALKVATTEWVISGVGIT